MLTLATVLSAAPNSGLGIFFHQLEIGVTLGAMYALVALGYTLVYGIIELINFAHGDIFMWATVLILVVVNALKITAPPSNFFVLIGLLLLLLVVGMVVSGSLNFMLERFVYRRLRKAPRLAPLIAAVGSSFVLETIVQIWRGSGFVSFPAIFPDTGITIGSVKIAFLDIFI